MSVIKNLKYKLNDFELSADQLEWPDHGITVLQGASGSGKSTFLSLLIGTLETKTPWQWDFQGTDLCRLSISDRRLGVVFQNYELFPHMSAEENVQIVMRARHPKSEHTDMNKKIVQMKLELGLEKCWDTKAHHLSGGEKQRVALLRAVISRPRLLLLDEPFSALDENLREEARLLLKSFIERVGIPALVITHDEKDVKALAHAVFHLENGRFSSVTRI